MERQENKYKYPQLEIFKEELELSHLRRKTLIVNIILVLFAGLLVYFWLGQNIIASRIYPSLVLLGIAFMANSALLSIPYDQYNNLKLSMYFTVMLIFSVAIVLIFSFETPSIFTVLFLAYAVTSIYQDYKTLVISSIILAASGLLLVVAYDEMFIFTTNNDPQIFLITIFMLVFVLLLTISSFILIKRKTFFYNQLSSIKEAEIRNIDLMKEVEKIKTGKESDYSSYFESLENFSKGLSEKIGVDDLFGRRIQVLKELKTKKPVELSEQFPEFDIHELEQLALMEFELNDKITKLAIKASKSKGISVSRKEIFSESQFKSFNHLGDSDYTKIISFAVFYTLLKINKPYLKKIEEDKLRDILYNSEYFYRVDKDIIEVYLDNNEVFSTIVDDYLKGGW